MLRAIEVEHISKAFGSRDILKDLSFNVNKGDVHGFLGPNGAGKTTTMKVITNLLRPDSGLVKVLGETLTNQVSMQINMGFLLDTPPLYPELTIREYLKFIAQLKSVPPRDISKKIDYCLDALDLRSEQYRLIENLSKGFKQRVGIAQAIIHMPEIVILDEPTVGLDPQSVIEIRNLILKLKEEHTILLSSHLLHEMSLVCDQITIISEGSILKSGTIEDIRKGLEHNQVISLELTRENQEFRQYISEADFVHDINEEQHGDVYRYDISVSAQTEVRPLLSQKVIEFNGEILNLTLKEKTLEDIFISITAKND